MKNLILIFAVLASFAITSCETKKACDHKDCKETCDSLKADSAKAAVQPVVDTVAVDSAK
jgi:predicted small secreted protein